ncbi:mesothelin [Camelus ferus]|nr:mesothelin [Camelus ferus]
MALQTARTPLESCGTSTHGSLLLLLLSLEKACPPGRKAQVVDEKLIFYEEWELEACVDGALLAAQMDRVNLIPFTYQQLHIFKRKLDEGYPESLIQHLRYFFLSVTPEDIHKWNVTSLETVKSLLEVTKGHKMDAQVAALIARYVVRGGQLDKATLETLATLHPTYLCLLSPEQLGSMSLNVVWVTRPQDLDACSPQQIAVLYPKARIVFKNMTGSEYFENIKPYLVAGQDVLDSLGLGLRGGIPNGYLVLDFSVQEALSGGPHLLGPGPVLTVTSNLLLAFILS